MEGIYILSSAGGFIMFLITLAYMSSTAGNLRKIRDESREQTRLLEQIERNTRPPLSSVEAAAKAEAPLNYMKDDKGVSGGVIAAILVIFIAVLLTVALTGKK